MKIILITLSIFLAQALWANTNLIRSSEAPVKSCDPSDLEACFQNRAEANYAFEMIHRDSQGQPIRTNKVVLLVHGLSDSPYFFRDIAPIIFKKGINVVAIRTTGHGTDKVDLEKVKRKYWYQDMKYGISRAKEFGDNVLIGGMSLGGALAVREALINSEVKGLLLFSPAVKMPKTFNNTCRMENPILRPILKVVGKIAGLDTNDYQARKEFGLSVRYQGIHNNGTCQLVKLTNEIKKIAQSKVNKDADLFSNLDIPIFNVISEYDTAIDVPFVSTLSKNAKSNERGLSHLVVYNNPETKPELISESKMTFKKNVPCMRHASVMLRPSPQMNYKEVKCEFTSSEEIAQFNGEQKFDFTPEINFEFDFLQERLEDFLNQI